MNPDRVYPQILIDLEHAEAAGLLDLATVERERELAHADWAAELRQLDREAAE